MFVCSSLPGAVFPLHSALPGVMILPVMRDKGGTSLIVCHFWASISFRVSIVVAPANKGALSLLPGLKDEPLPGVVVVALDLDGRRPRVRPALSSGYATKIGLAQDTLLPGYCLDYHASSTFLVPGYCLDYHASSNFLVYYFRVEMDVSESTTLACCMSGDKFKCTGR